MPLNPFFLQGSTNEQFLVQDIINEQLKIYGVDVYYLPRKIFKTDNIIREIQSSKFDDVFMIEAYINNYDGYAPDSDIMTKFGLRLKNEISLTISRERYEEFIAPFLEGISSGIREGRITEYDFADLITRPKEGDLIYFPLGERLFEIKRVEHEKPFYQLGTNYVYELSCELYEYENELIDTAIEEVDNTVEDEGYITSLTLVGTARTATATAGISSGAINEIFVNNDGFGYRTTPTITFSEPPVGGTRATAVGITTRVANVQSLLRIELTNAGAGYTVAPTITISGGGGSGAAATCSIGGTLFSVSSFTVTDSGNGYGSAPTVTFVRPDSLGATATATIGSGGTVTSTQIVNPGSGYTSAPTVTVSAPNARTGVIGTSVSVNDGSGYQANETISLVPYNNQVSLGGTEAIIRIDSVDGSGSVTGYTTVYGGRNYEVGINPSADFYEARGGSGNDNFRIMIDSIQTIAGTAASVTSTVSAGGTISALTITNPGAGYTVAPTVTISNDNAFGRTNTGVDASAVASINADGKISALRILKGGSGYTVAPGVQFTGFATVGVGTFIYNEIVTGETSGTTARVRDFRTVTSPTPGVLPITSLRVSLNTGEFNRGEIVVGSISSARYVISNYDDQSYDNPYDVNEEIELEADSILDFTESNPFGSY